MDGVGTGGGSLTLGDLIDEHGDALLADLLDHFGVYLPDVVFKWPPRLLLSLAFEGLPLGCRLYAHMEGGPERWREFHGWDRTAAMLADHWDLHVQINTPKGKRAPTYPRPSTAPKGTSLFAMRPRAPKED